MHTFLSALAAVHPLVFHQLESEIVKVPPVLALVALVSAAALVTAAARRVRLALARAR